MAEGTARGAGEAQADAELVAGLRAGEARALTRVYGRYRERVYSFLLRLCGRPADADDLFQETFVQLARHARRLHPETDLRAFLFTVARNRYLSHRRTALWRRLRLALFSSEVPAPAAPATPHEATALSGTAQRLERALQELPPPQREVLLLVGVEGLEQAAAARILNLSEPALRQRLSRARARLRTLIPELDLEEGKGKGDRDGTRA